MDKACVSGDNWKAITCRTSFQRVGQKGLLDKMRLKEIASQGMAYKQKLRILAGGHQHDKLKNRFRGLSGKKSLKP